MATVTQAGTVLRNGNSRPKPRMDVAHAVRLAALALTMLIVFLLLADLAAHAQAMPNPSNPVQMAVAISSLQNQTSNNSAQIQLIWQNLQDMRIREEERDEAMSNRLSRIEGMGAGMMGLLTLLQIVGLVKSGKRNR